jgi:hypothetical protein
VADGLKKAFAIIGGLAIGIGITYVARSVSAFTLSDEIWIGIGIILVISSASSLYFMTKGNG